LVDNEKFNLIISTGPPHSTHLIAKALKSHSKLPWIADFRDPWTEVFYNEDLYRTKWAEKKDLKLEKSVIERADAVLCVSDFTAELVKAKTKYPNKVHTLINGYDHEVFEHVQAVKNDTFTIAYIGYMGKHHPYHVFIQGIEKVLQKVDSTTEIQLDLAGKIDPEIITAFKTISEVKVNYEGVVTHLEAIQKMKSADLLLLSIPTSSYSKGIITGKLLEYIATGNPIVLVGEKAGDAAKILKNFNNTLAIDETSPDDFASFLTKLLPTRPTENNHPKAKEYTREVTALQLKGIIDEVIGG
jgi:glycosyltransferase involved in cell wall biosynthesis